MTNQNSNNNQSPRANHSNPNVELSKAKEFSKNKEHKSEQNLSKNAEPKVYNSMLSESEYHKGAKGPVGVDSRHSRQQAEEFQNNSRPSKH